MAVGDHWLVGPEDWSGTMKNLFLRWGAQDNNVLGYPKLSREMIELQAPNWIARRYIGTVADFTRGASDYIIITRRKNAYTEEMQKLSDEFKEVPTFRMGWTRFSVRVDEWGISYQLTERLVHFSTFNVEQIVRTYLSDVVRGSIDRMIWKDAYLWTDFVFVKTNTLKVVAGKAVGDPQSRIAGTPKQFSTDVNPITINMVDFNTDVSGAPSPITAQDLLAIRAELIRRRMRQGITAVICNEVFERELLTDPNLQTFFAFARPTAIGGAELGSVYSFEVIVDDTGILDETLNAINTYPTPGVQAGTPKSFRAIAVFIGADGYREAVALAETVRSDVPVSFGRFNRIGAITYRSQQPIWFYSDPYAYQDPTTGQPLPEYVRRPAGFVVVAG